jgi:uncharacterized protein (DUF2141 family)
MLKNKISSIFFILLALTVVGCANRGFISGGLKDTIAPVLTASFPKNLSVNFKGKEIHLTFDEYVKLKNVNKQLIVSPPMKYNPEVSPLTPSKIITIKINDTLQENTTYSFNFGQSIEDNNEGNPYNQFKYIFSTGSYIDSLKVGGTIKDALNKKEDSFVSVMLYEVNKKFTDSAVYKSVPRYITNTLDSLKSFKIENVKAGKYLLVAMKDENNNNKFDPKKDKIGFRKQLVTIPNDSLFELKLFKEVLAFKTFKPVQTTGNKLLLGYEGNPKNMKVVLKKGSEIIPTIVTQFPAKDSVQVWYKPIKSDSLNLAVANGNYIKSFTFKKTEQKKDTLSFTPKTNLGLSKLELFTIRSSRPIVKFDESKIRVTDKDSVEVKFTTSYDVYAQELKFDIPKEPLQTYQFHLLPGALTDYIDQKNDTLSFKVTTKNAADYGNLRVNLTHVKQFPVLVQITNEKGDVIASEYSDKVTSVDFMFLEPAKYTLRVIYDANGNKEWDSGNFLERRQPEEVIYFPKEIDVRGNWDVEQSFDLSE